MNGIEEAVSKMYGHRVDRGRSMKPAVRARSSGGRKWNWRGWQVSEQLITYFYFILNIAPSCQTCLNDMFYIFFILLTERNVLFDSALMHFKSFLPIIGFWTLLWFLVSINGLREIPFGVRLRV